MVQKVILIDDDPDDHEIFSMAISEASSGIACVLYDSAETALEELSKQGTTPPDYIFLDLNMPRMNGMQFLEYVKKDDALAGIPVVIYSTSILPSIKTQALQYGASDFLAKPTSHLELIKSLKKLLSIE
ncbi:MAG TPA: response regulator [Chitinophagaceae bacterium]|nr:response regulator [Chitinophagaceae bacterium]